MRSLRIVVPAVVFAVAHFVAAQDIRTLESSLKRDLSKGQITFRIPYSNKELEFGQDGICRRNCDRGSWVRDASLLVSDVKLSARDLTIWGNKLIVFYDLAGKRAALQTSTVVKTRFAFAGELTQDAILALLAKVVLAPGEPLPNAAPSNLRDWPRGADAGSTVVNGKLQPVGQTADHQDVFSPGKAVTAPKATYAPDPEFPREAGKGSGGVQTMVIIDEYGFPQVLQVEKVDASAFIRPAIEALSQWTFKPATYNDNPVPCRVNVTVDFRLY